MRESLGLGLGQPWHVRYMLWLYQFVVTEPLHLRDYFLGTHWAGDAQRATSWQSRSPIMDIVIERMPQTLWVVWPGLAISLTVLSVNYIGDGLRDALDPRIRGRWKTPTTRIRRLSLQSGHGANSMPLSFRQMELIQNNPAHIGTKFP